MNSSSTHYTLALLVSEELVWKMFPASEFLQRQQCMRLPSRKHVKGELRIISARPSSHSMKRFALPRSRSPVPHEPAKKPVDNPASRSFRGGMIQLLWRVPRGWPVFADH